MPADVSKSSLASMAGINASPTNFNPSLPNLPIIKY
jgi:hypothetical protein